MNQTGRYQHIRYAAAAKENPEDVMYPNSPLIELNNMKMRTSTDQIVVKPPDEVDDVILSVVEAWINKIVTNTVAKYIIGVLFVGLFLISFVLLIARVFPNIPGMSMLTNNAIGRMLNKIPLAVLLISAFVSTVGFKLLGSTVAKQFTQVALFALAVVMLFYVWNTWSSCKHYMLLIAAIYTIAIVAAKYNLLGFSSISQSSIIEKVIQFHFIIFTLLVVFDSYLITPNCAKLNGNNANSRQYEL